MWEASDSRNGLFNKLAMHTCGRSTNVGDINVDHFVLDGDCIGVQFPISKTDQTGEGGNDILMHFFPSPHDPFKDIFLEFGIYFMYLVAGLSSYSCSNKHGIRCNRITLNIIHILYMCTVQR